jgi:membrane dipeptidase
MMDRRRLLSAAALAAAPLGQARAAPSARGPLIINALGDLENPNLALTRPYGAETESLTPDFDARTIADAKASGLTAVNVTLGYVFGPEDPYEYTIRTISAWDRLLREHPQDLIKVNSAADLERAHREGRIGVVYGFQNAVQVDDKPERIETFAGLGVRVIQLTYNPPNTLGDGSMAPLNRGMTPLGRQVIEQLNANRVMVDLSHSGERTCLDAIAASRQPISINHTGCRALCDLPRNKTDAELRGVAEKGGFVGIYFMPYLCPSGHASASDVVAHIEHAVNVCGEDHVGVGTDGPVTPIDSLQAYRSHLEAEIADRASKGVGATGERTDTYPFVVDLRGVDQFRKLERLLRGRGFSQARIEKILGHNFLAYAREVWGA